MIGKKQKPVRPGRARRQASRQTQGRRKNDANRLSWLKAGLRSLPIIAGFGVAIYLGSLLMNTGMPEVLPIEQVTVEGQLHFVDADAIRSIIGRNLKGGYFTLDLDSIREQLMRQPWIKDVALRRQWPAELKVSIEEQQPVAYWNDDAFLNRDGEIFKPEKVSRDLALPSLKGPAGLQQKVWLFMNRLYREMALLDYDVTELVLDDRRAWRMRITPSGADAVSNENGIMVRLGRFDTEKRLQRFVRVLPALTQSVAVGKIAQGIERIDMRYPNGFAVKREEKTDAGAQTSEA